MEKCEKLKTKPASSSPPAETWSFGKILSLYVMGATIRYWLLFSNYQSIIANHIEVSTPLNSWKRVSEGLYLQKKGINPYEGDLLHEAPLTILLYKTIFETFSTIPVEVIFLAVDILTAILLFFIGKRYMFQLYVQQENNMDKYAEDGMEFLLTKTDFVNAPAFVAIAFLFHPYTIFNCVGLSTMVFHNFFMAAFLLAMLYGNVLVSSFCLCFCTMMSLYPVILIIPLFLYFSIIYQNKTKAILTLISFIALMAASLAVSVELSSGKIFLRNVYGFILTVPDLQPNIGLFWYFFTEMFDHFRDLFICSFQINATILYLVSLSVKFRKDPFLLTVALLFLVSVFKSYPCLGDVGFVLSLLPCFIHLFNYSQQGFLVGVIFLITSVLGPILWHLWIYSNSANANFYFGVTLAFAIAQIFLITDILFAYLKREFCLLHGKERKIQGREALLILE